MANCLPHFDLDRMEGKKCKDLWGYIENYKIHLGPLHGFWQVRRSILMTCFDGKDHTQCLAQNGVLCASRMVSLWYYGITFFDLQELIGFPPRKMEEILIITFRGFERLFQGKTLWCIARLSLIWTIWQERNTRIFICLSQVWVE